MSNLSSSVYLLDLDVVRSEPKLPGYTPRPSAECSSIPVERESKSFEYKLAKNMTGPGISLTVSGNSRISKELPSFMEGDKVAGAVRVLSVNNGQDIRAIDVSVKGRVVTGRNADGEYTFLDLRKTIWTAELDKIDAHRDPANANDYIWPFSLDLPKEIVLAQDDSEKDKAFPLPHTFSEAGIPARVYYELVVCLKQSKWKMNRRFLLENLENFSQFQQREAELLCTLHLKNSLLGYTPGSSIPLLLEIRSQDRQALELLSSPDAVAVKLSRRISYKDLQMCGGNSSRWSRVTEIVGEATWSLHEAALSKESVLSESYHSTTLAGKINLKRGLVPSAVIANLAIEYFVSVYPFSSPAFQSKDSSSVSLISQAVQINSDISACHSGPTHRC
ncbi:hypothetical protein BT96DRAFT_1066021 [Gymnopus androsaceus JB14]|uniref:Arrestin-like N-terminal domain-containing protein n=1 Tax=Gymnopus androsaceus JB14 TaxID=1447944 RepID=A0A6A4I3Z2_9AGAR|nr:hypothetical protein BT96DRAFT_1066021 [Gymnopus androsaceus JB14]